MVYAAVLGYGTVGSGVVEALNMNREKIKKTLGDEIVVKYVLDLRDFKDDPVSEILVHDYSVIENDDSVSIVIETMGGVHPAFDFSMAALKKGKSVCTSNKELVAEKGFELLETARANNANYMFEASCGGGIPIIRALNTSLAGEKIEEITGILNGTTNYILTKMMNEGSDYASVLADAQRLGYAEKDPTADVEGFDACRKIAILTSLVTGKRVDYKEIHTEGITGVSADDISSAAKLGMKVRLLARSRMTDGKAAAMVAPFAVAGDMPISSVSDVFNAVFVKGNVLGDAMFYGRGAGKLPTASAVVADVVDCALHAGSFASYGWDEEALETVPFGEIKNRFLVRVPEENKEEAQKAFENCDFFETGIPGQCALVTGEMTEDAFKEKCSRVSEVSGFIRVCLA